MQEQLFDQTKWTSSNKCYAHLYIDDAALGIPLKQDVIYKDDSPVGESTGRPYVDWNKVEALLQGKGILGYQFEHKETV